MFSSDLPLHSRTTLLLLTCTLHLLISKEPQACPFKTDLPDLPHLPQFHPPAPLSVFSVSERTYLFPTPETKKSSLTASSSSHSIPPSLLYCQCLNVFPNRLFLSTSPWSDLPSCLTWASTKATPFQLPYTFPRSSPSDLSEHFSKSSVWAHLASPVSSYPHSPSLCAPAPRVCFQFFKMSLSFCCSASAQWTVLSSIMYLVLQIDQSKCQFPREASLFRSNSFMIQPCSNFCSFPSRHLTWVFIFVCLHVIFFFTKHVFPASDCTLHSVG